MSVNEADGKVILQRFPDTEPTWIVIGMAEPVASFANAFKLVVVTA